MGVLFLSPQAHDQRSDSTERQAKQQLNICNKKYTYKKEVSIEVAVAAWLQHAARPHVSLFALCVLVGPDCARHLPTCVHIVPAIDHGLNKWFGFGC